MSRLLAGVTALLAALVLAAPASAAPWPPREPIANAGRWLVDADGRVVVLHGLNMVDKRPPYVPASKGFGEDDADFLRRAGFNAVRLGLIHKGLEAVRGVYDTAYVEQFAETVRLLRSRGILVVPDFHQDYFNEITGGEGFPDWMVQVAGPPTRRDAWPFDSFWRNTNGYQDAFAAAWGRVAARLAGEPGVVGYDLLNEPFPGTREQECAQAQGCPSFDRSVLTPFYARVLRAVRAADPARLAFVEPHVIFNGGAASSLESPGDSRVGFSFHLYCFERAGLAPCAQRRRLVFDNAESLSRRHGWSLLMSEFGATDSIGELEAITAEADRRMVSWLEWAYWNHDPFAARPHEGLIRDLGLAPEGANVKEDKLVVLSRPYPRAVAGTPLGWSWDRQARVFEASWSTTPAGGPLAPGAVSEVVLPAPAYPAGWHVAAISGGSVLDSGERDVLAIAATRGATEVRVRVESGWPPKAKRKAKTRKGTKAKKRKARAKRKPKRRT